MDYSGSLAFGLTSCDPATLDPADLPEDSDCLLDRPEYWVVSKDVANTPDTGDELSFQACHVALLTSVAEFARFFMICYLFYIRLQINPDGSVEFSRNGGIPSVFLHIDPTVPLWAFWDVYGNTQEIVLAGATCDPVVRGERDRQDSTAARENDRNTLSLTDLVGLGEMGHQSAAPRSASSSMSAAPPAGCASAGRHRMAWRRKPSRTL